MFESPGSLQEVCLDYISSNIEALCETQASENSGEQCMVFRDDDSYFHSTLSDQLLSYLNEKHKLNDDTLSLFTSQATCLKHVQIRDADVTVKGLRVLRTHKIIELEAVGIKGASVNDLMGCLGEWTLANLRVLNVANSSFMNSAKFCVVVSLSKLKSLQSLNVSNTEFNEHGLEIIAEDLPGLESLNISATPISDLSPLRKCKGRLKSLSMYNLKASHPSDIVPVLCELENLRHLDVSDDLSAQPFVNLEPEKFRVEELLERHRTLPLLTSLDISGNEHIPEYTLRRFLETHPHLVFLGLALTNVYDMAMFANQDSAEFVSHIIVSGEGSENQIMESLRRYQSRPTYVQRALFHLFQISQSFLAPRTDVIRLILPAMRSHPKELSVQMAATACLYNLSKGDMGTKIHPLWLAKLVELTLDAMQNFPNHQQLQKNALLTLCSDRILQDVTFDRFRCAKLVMECLCSFDDVSMNRMSVAICSILAAKIPTDQTSQLGAQAHFMQKLLRLVKDKMAEREVDVTMKFTLSALWNLTDESPVTCQVFLGQGGLDLFMEVLDTYKDEDDGRRTQVETKVLGLINNLAEVKSLRRALMRDDVILAVRDLLRSQHIEVSYFAAGIIAHIVTGGGTSWEVEAVGRREILDDLRIAVLNWKQPETEMVAYRSFSPFFPLLSHNEAEVQLWAVWAILHVCSKNGSRYCPMLVSEGGASLLNNIVSSHSPQQNVGRLARQVLEAVEVELSKPTRPAEQMQ